MDWAQTVAVPTREEALAYFDTYHTPAHVRAHCLQVNRVALYLATSLHEAGESVNIPLVDCASLLHDTIRVTEWDTLNFDLFPETPSETDIAVWKSQRAQYPPNIPHAHVTAGIFEQQYPELAQVIALHSIIDAPRVQTWEEKIVQYADRRVAHDQIVTLQERLDEAYTRYAQTAQRPLEKDPEILAALQRIEHDIFSRIGGDPDHLPL